MKHRDMLPFRRTALAVAAALIAPAAAQNVWGGQSQQYCSNQNTGSDYSPGMSRDRPMQAMKIDR